MELISRDETIDALCKAVDNKGKYEGEWLYTDEFVKVVQSLPTVEERKEGEWIRTGRTNIYGGEELMCPFCGDRLMVQNIEYELYCRQCGALLGNRAKGE